MSDYRVSRLGQRQPPSLRRRGHGPASTSTRQLPLAAPAAVPLKLFRCPCDGGCPRCAPIQAKLKINQPGDRSEQEADRAADAVMGNRTPATPGVRNPIAVQRSPCCADGLGSIRSEEDDEGVLRRSAVDDTTARAPPSNAVRDALGSPSQPLDSDTRSFMESRFGHDFGDVRIHASASAADAARSVAARAFTAGHHIVFGAGQWAPQTGTGQRLLAHELAHTLQQEGGTSTLQRACDPVALSARTTPVFFPAERVVMEVFLGARNLVRWAPFHTAVGLMQQALVDLGYDLGPYGPRRDGIDRIFGPVTEQGIRDFQTNESIVGAAPGVLDQPTLRCLDEVRSHLVVPAHQTGVVTTDQYRITDQLTGGRDEDLFFERGSSALDGDDELKIARLAKKYSGRSVTLIGFVSEEELVDIGAQLATDRVTAVDAELGSQPAPPLRVPSPRPTVSSGVADYRNRYKVEVVETGTAPQTPACPPGALPHLPPDPYTETPIIQQAITTAVDWMDDAIPELMPGDTEGEQALTTYFGSIHNRALIKSKLFTWRNHLDTTVRKQHNVGTHCSAICERATAFGDGNTGNAAWITFCPRFFGPLDFLPDLNQDEKKAFLVMHEAGHGSIDTTDYAYGHRRLIEFIAQRPAVALKNTDSYTLMVLCLVPKKSFCTPPVTVDTPFGMNTDEFEEARRGVAWLESWLVRVFQDLTGLYGTINDARQQGRSVTDVYAYFGRNVFPLWIRAFDIHRPPGDPPPTFREQSTIAAITDRVKVMRDAAAKSPLTITKDASPAATMHWASGGPLSGPDKQLFLTDVYFALTTDRRRVETLLPLIILASSSISAPMRPRYEQFIKDDVRRNWNNLP